MKLVLNILVIMVSLSVLVGYTNESENNIEQSLSAEMEANYLSWDLEPILNAKTAEDNSVLSVMFDYQRESNEQFVIVSPTHEDYYYNRNVLYFILSEAVYQDEKISFYWRNSPIEFGEVTGLRYELIDCFVNSRGTEIIIFAIREGQRYVFHHTNRPEGNVFNLELSNNPILNRFMEESIDGQSIESVRTARSNSILSTIFSYQKGRKEIFLRVTPQNNDYYYGFDIVEDILKQANYRGQSISFQWSGETIGEGEEYELIESFVSESGNELIIFAMKDGQRYVFHNTNPPGEDVFKLQLSEDFSLNYFIKDIPFD